MDTSLCAIVVLHTYFFNCEHSFYIVPFHAMSGPFDLLRVLSGWSGGQARCPPEFHIMS